MTFTSTSTDSDGTIVKTEWDWDNDGSFDTSGKVVTHAFPLPGAQIVTLRVTDEDDASHSLQKTVNVLNRAPTATVGMAPASARQPRADRSSRPLRPTRTARLPASSGTSTTTASSMTPPA